MSNTALKLEQYKEIQEATGENPILLQSFILNNNTDIKIAIEFWKSELQSAQPEEKQEIENLIKRYKNMMVQRLIHTENIFATYMPLMQHGPAKINSDFVKTEDEDVKDREIKVVKHPASKGKKSKDTKTVNDEVGEQIANEREKRAKDNPVEKVEVKLENKNAPAYSSIYPVLTDRIDAINDVLIPSIEKRLETGTKEDLERARKTCKLHFKNYGPNIHFCTENDIERFLNWLKLDVFRSRSPLDVLANTPLSITEIVDEAQRLIIESGLNKGQLMDAMRPFILGKMLKEHKTREDIVATEEGYADFFQRSLSFMLDEDQKRRATAELEKSKETRDSVKGDLLRLHKKDGWKAIRRMAKDLNYWVTQQGDKSTITDRIGEVAGFVKSTDPELYKEYMANRPDKKPKEVAKVPDAPVVEDTVAVEEKSTDKETEAKPVVETSEPDKPVSKSIYPKLEELIKHKPTREHVAEFLISIINKSFGVIGEQKDGIDSQIEGLTTLATKRFLEMNPVKDCEDWKEGDISHFMASDILPFITDGYSILRATNDDELKEHLAFYLKEFPAGKEKERSAALKEVLALSEKPRSKYMKKVASKVRKGNFTELNDFIKEINDSVIEEQKKTK